MNLSNLKPAEGSTKTRKELVVDRFQVWVELLQEVIKCLNQDRDIKESRF